jgi:hypothetical protein
MSIGSLSQKLCPPLAHVDKGIGIIEKRIHGKKVLVILDDMDDFENLHKLVKKEKLGPGK